MKTNLSPCRYIPKIFTLLFFLLLPLFSYSDDFDRTRLQAEIIQSGIDSQHLHPSDIDLFHDQKLEKIWNEKGQWSEKNIMQWAFPPDVTLINHSLPYSSSPTLVKLNDGATAVIARAKYTFNHQTFGTNITFGKNALLENISYVISNKSTETTRWLVQKSAKAAILYLHGGGTRTTSGATATQMINHFAPMGIDVVAPDLPMHAGGPRTIMGIKNDILALGAFARKYIPPDVPLFVYGHSWGGSYADELMQISGEYDGKGSFFHPSLKGVIITSPAMDPAPGKPFDEKVEEMFKRYKESLTLTDQAPPPEQKIWSDITKKGKHSVLGGITAYLTILEKNQIIPEHGGAKYLPALMIMGTRDLLVYLGNEDLVHNYYDNLSNVEAHYLEQRPYLFSKFLELMGVGHLISDYAKDSNNHTPINFDLTSAFIAKHLGQSQQWVEDKTTPSNNLRNLQRYSAFIDLIQIYANDLAFRKWLDNLVFDKIELIKRARPKIKKADVESKQRIKQIQKLISESHPNEELFQLLKQVAFIQENQKTDLQEDETQKELKQTLERLQQIIKDSSAEQAQQASQQVLSLIEEFLHNEGQNETQNTIFQENVEKQKRLAHLINLIKQSHPERELLETLKQLASSTPKNFKNFKTQLKILKASFSNKTQNQELINELLEAETISQAQFIATNTLITDSRFHNAPSISKEKLNQVLIENQINYLPLIAIKKIEELRAQYNTEENPKIKRDIFYEVEKVLKNYDPSYTLYRTLIRLSKSTPSQSLEDYIPPIQEFLKYFSSYPQYITLSSQLKTLLESETFEEIEKQSLIILEEHIPVKLKANSPLIKEILFSHKTNYNKDTLISDLKQFMLPEKIEKEIINLFEKRINNPMQYIDQDFKRLIADNAAENKIFALCLLLKDITFMHTLEKLKIDLADSERSQLVEELLIAENKQEKSFEMLNTLYIHSSVKLSSKLQSKISATRDTQFIQQLLTEQNIQEQKREKIFSAFQEYKNLLDYSVAKHVPTLQDFHNYYENGDSLSIGDKEFQESIDIIENLVKENEEIEEEIKNLTKKKGIEQTLSQNINQINRNFAHHVSLVNQAFDKAIESPPPTLENEYKELKELFDKMVELYENLHVKLIYAAKFLKERSSTENLSQFVETLFKEKEIAPLVEEASSAYNNWNKKQWEVNNLLVESIIQSETKWSDEENEMFKKAFTSLYGKEAKSLYPQISEFTKLKSSLESLAEVESTLMNLREKQHRIIRDYYIEYPSNIIEKEIITLDAKKLFNPNITTDIHKHVEKNVTHFQELVSNWKKLKGKLPPNIPTCRKVFSSPQ